MATTVYETIAGIIQQVYDGALAHTFARKAPSVARLQELGRIKVIKKTLLSLPTESVDIGDSSTIADGGTLPEAKTMEYTGAQWRYKIILELLRVGRVQQIGSTNLAEFYRTNEGKDLLESQMNERMSKIARTIHKQIIALTTAASTDITSLGDAVANTTNTYANIARSSNAQWRPYVNSNGGLNRSLTEAMLEAHRNELINNREADTTEVWCGNSSFQAVRTIVNTSAPARNNNPEELRAGARRIYWSEIPFIEMPGMDANAMYWLDMFSDDGITLCQQHDQDFLSRPESTNSYDDRISVATHRELRVGNPWKQGAILDVA